MIVIHIKTWKDWKKQFLDWVKEPRQNACIDFCNCMKVSTEENTSIAIEEYVKEHGLTNDQQKELDYIISKESRERILARMKEVSECVANCGVSADRLAQRLREFAEAGRPKDETEGKASGTVARDERRKRWNAALEISSGTCGNCGSEVQPGANVMLPMSEDE